MPASQLPTFSVVNRYIVGQFFSMFVPVLFSLVLLYIVIDAFDRVDTFLRHQASFGAVARYLIFKIPLILTQIAPPAVVIAVLLGFGLLARRNEIIALRAGGVSLLQTAIPIAAVGVGISIATFAWNETVVPYSSRMFQYVNNVEIRKRGMRGILSDREIWYHGANGFYSIDYVDRSHQRVLGLVIYRISDVGDGFHLRSVIQIPEAKWRSGRWVISGESVQHGLASGSFSTTPLRLDTFTIEETLDDFLEVQREPEELSYAALRQRIADLTRKGIDASFYLVDLNLKLALPFANTVLVLVAIPIGGRLRRHTNMATVVGLGTAVGFGYWVLLGLATSLGENGAIPPLVAAWAANAIYLLVGAALFLYSE